MYIYVKARLANLLFAWVLKKEKNGFQHCLRHKLPSVSPAHCFIFCCWTHLLALSWCCQRWHGVHYNLFLRLLCANWGMINSKTKCCIKKPQTPSNLVEIMHSKASLWGETQPCLEQYEQSSNFPCKLPALALVFFPLRKVTVVKGTLSTSLCIIVMCYSWSFAYFCKQVYCFCTGWSLPPCACLLQLCVQMRKANVRYCVTVLR